MATEPNRVSRRSLLALGAVGAAGTFVSPLGAAATPVGPGICGTPLTAETEIANVPTFLDTSGLKFTFSYNPTFYSRLEVWWRFWYANTPASWKTPASIYSLGTYDNRNDGCDITLSSMHNWGRAIDLTRIYASTPTLTKVFDAYSPSWVNGANATQIRNRKWYWATAASMHYHFQSVLTYIYDTRHFNHLHVDNGFSGSGNSVLDPYRSPQWEYLKASLKYVWGYPTSVGVPGWDDASADYAKQALARIGINGLVTDSVTNWRQYNKATFRFGVGTQSY